MAPQRNTFLHWMIIKSESDLLERPWAHIKREERRVTINWCLKPKLTGFIYAKITFPHNYFLCFVPSFSSPLEPGGSWLMVKSQLHLNALGRDAFELSAEQNPLFHFFTPLFLSTGYFKLHWVNSPSCSLFQGLQSLPCTFVSLCRGIQTGSIPACVCMWTMSGVHSFFPMRKQL